MSMPMMKTRIVKKENETVMKMVTVRIGGQYVNQHEVEREENEVIGGLLPRRIWQEALVWEEEVWGEEREWWCQRQRLHLEWESMGLCNWLGMSRGWRFSSFLSTIHFLVFRVIAQR